MTADLESPLVVSLSLRSSLSDLEAAIARLDSDEERAATGFVFRTMRPVGPREVSDDERSAVVAALRRAGTKPIYLLGRRDSPAGLSLVRLQAERLATVEDEEIALLQIRSCQVRSLLGQKPGIWRLPQSQTSHYVAPSGRHCGQFIRVADMIRDRESLDTLAFWFRPTVVGARVVVGDTWGIASVIIRSLQLARSEAHFDCLPAHPARQREFIAGVVKGATPFLRQDDKVVILASISDTGSLIRAIEREFQERVPFDIQIQVVSILATGSFSQRSGDDTMAKLPDSFRSYEAKDCPHCKEGSTAHRVDPALYFITRRQSAPVNITAHHAAPGQRFVKKYSDHPGVLRAHHHDANDSRHHSLDVCVEKLIDIPLFAQQLETLLDKIAPFPQAVVVPRHTAGIRLGEYAAEHYGCPLVVSNNLRPNSASDDEPRANEHSIESLRSIDNLLVIDDVANTGSRLSEYNRAIREELTNIKRVTFLVAVNRMESARQWESLQSSLTDQVHWKAELLCVETLLLPTQKAEDCPWCIEYDQLAALAEPLPEVPQWMLERLSRLSELENGIQSEPLLRLPGCEARVVARGSPMVHEGASEIEAVFACASALQRLRTDEQRGKRLDPSGDVPHVLGANLMERYSEGLLQAALLRLVRGEEWDSEYRREGWKELLSELADGKNEIAVGELLLGIRRNGFSTDRTEELARSLQSRFGTAAPQLIQHLWGEGAASDPEETATAPE